MTFIFDRPVGSHHRENLFGIAGQTGDVIANGFGFLPIDDSGRDDHRDTLIIKADGTYKQIIHIEYATKSPVDFESDWQAWWLEYGNNNIPVQHLEGYRLCGYNAGISCDIAGGSGIHMCGIEYKDIPNEGVLYVIGKSKITLTLPLGLEDNWGYWREP